jgi:ubiquitin C-terminal hydrolase
MLISDKIADEIGQPIPPPPKKLEEDPANLENKIHHMIYNCNNKKMSKFVENIQGIQISILQCKNSNCNEQYYNPEVFTTMMVDIPPSQTQKRIDLINLLLDFYKIEELASETWKCDKCAQQYGARKQSKLLKMPKVLIVVLKRFLMTETGNFRKITDSVDISPDLEFGFENKAFKYRLCAMGNHLGSYNGGHYNAIIKSKLPKTNSTDQQDKQEKQYEWTCYDDTTCYPLKNNETEILANNKEAYILFYQIISD